MLVLGGRNVTLIPGEKLPLLLSHDEGEWGEIRTWIRSHKVCLEFSCGSPFPRSPNIQFEMRRWGGQDVVIAQYSWNIGRRETIALLRGGIVSEPSHPFFDSTLYGKLYPGASAHSMSKVEHPILART